MITGQPESNLKNELTIEAVLEICTAETQQNIGSHPGRENPSPYCCSKTMSRCLSSGTVFFSVLPVKKFLFFNKEFCDLYCVCCSALTHLVTAAPEVYTVLVNEVAADPADINDILVGCKDRHRIDFI